MKCLCLFSGKSKKMSSICRLMNLPRQSDNGKGVLLRQCIFMYTFKSYLP